MSQSLPSSSPAPVRPVDAAEVRGQLVGKHVCPFCGVMRADPAQPCARCTLEDTQATRHATKQRIGPWFVLQARNPSAPGMKLATLQSLVRRGHITPRSIVRGPTTDQMWAFAANARGLSREFGLCYHCGEAIDPVATRCPHCSKSQELPADHDALLETLAASGAASMFSQPPGAAPTPPVDLFASIKNSDTGMDGGTSLDLQVGPPVSADSRPRSLATHAPRQLVQRSAMPMKEESILSARELAAAFQLDFKPPGSRANRPRRPVRTLAALLLIALVAGGIVLFLRPDWRKTTQDWTKARWAALTASLEQPAKPTNTAGPTSPAANPTANGAGTPAGGVNTRPPTPSPTPIREPTRPVTQKPNIPVPTPTPAPTVVITPPTPTPSPVQPAKPIAVVPPPEPTPTPEGNPPPSDLTIDQATALASNLRNKAIDAQAKGDWAGAVKLYEQIQRLPRDAWPADLTRRLDVARKRAGA